MQKYKDTNFTNLVFPSKKNQPFHEMVILESIHNVIENDMTPKTLQRILGHSSLQMTMNLYCHVSDDKLFDEMKKMEK